MTDHQRRWRIISIPERRIVRRIFGPKKKNITQQYKIRINIELQQLNKEPDIVALLQYRRFTWDWSRLKIQCYNYSGFKMEVLW